MVVYWDGTFSLVTALAVLQYHALEICQEYRQGILGQAN